MRLRIPPPLTGGTLAPLSLWSNVDNTSAAKDVNPKKCGLRSKDGVCDGAQGISHDGLFLGDRSASKAVLGADGVPQPQTMALRRDGADVPMVARCQGVLARDPPTRAVAQRRLLFSGKDAEMDKLASLAA